MNLVHDWVPEDACTLPTVDRPLRVAEFDALFADALREASIDGTHARLTLADDTSGADLAERVGRLVAAETECCSFFEFAVRRSEGGPVELQVTVPPERTDVLAALVTRARARAPQNGR